jgi:type IV pilus assembly protein PilM
MSAQPFGLDIGRYYIKVVSIEVSGKKKTLKAASIFSGLLGGIQTESNDDLVRLSEVIKKGVKNAKIDSEKCVVSLMESQIVTRSVQMPVLSDKELSAAINWEAEQYIPLPLKDVVLQYKVLNRPKSNTPGAKMDVFLVAAPKRVVEKYLKVVKGAGFTVEALETESTALARSLITLPDKATIILSLGAISSELVIVVNGNVFFTRSISVGGSFLTKTIMDQFNVPLSQAEEYKKTYGLLEDKLSGKIASAIKPNLELVVSELLRAIEFSRSKVKGFSSTRIIISGGGAYLPGLSEFLVQRVGVEVSLGDPWSSFIKERIVTNLSSQSSIYSVATGLALRT